MSWKAKDWRMSLLIILLSKYLLGIYCETNAGLGMRI